MQNESWMQPARQFSEAVLLPALERPNPRKSRFVNRYLPPPASQDAFLPANEAWGAPHAPTSACPARFSGSMAGRSVLRAAGIARFRRQ